MKRIPMTLRGSEKLKEELDYLKNVRRPEIIQNISQAREHGDLKENAEYHAAREQQGFCEGRIQEIESKLASAHIIDVAKLSTGDRVVFGATVGVENLETTYRQTYSIVGDDEANLKERMISIHSPIARGLIGHKEGDIVRINTPQGQVRYKIFQVKYC